MQTRSLLVVEHNSSVLRGALRCPGGVGCLGAQGVHGQQASTGS